MITINIQPTMYLQTVIILYFTIEALNINYCVQACHAVCSRTVRPARQLHEYTCPPHHTCLNFIKTLIITIFEYLMEFNNLAYACKLVLYYITLTDWS